MLFSPQSRSHTADGRSNCRENNNWMFLLLFRDSAHRRCDDDPRHSTVACWWRPWPSETHHSYHPSSVSLSFFCDWSGVVVVDCYPPRSLSIGLFPLLAAPTAAAIHFQSINQNYNTTTRPQPRRRRSVVPKAICWIADCFENDFLCSVWSGFSDRGDTKMLFLRRKEGAINEANFQLRVLEILCNERLGWFTNSLHIPPRSSDKRSTFVTLIYWQHS